MKLDLFLAVQIDRVKATVGLAFQRPSEIPHGIRTGYNQGCKCLRCRLANAVYVADLRARQRMERAS